MPKYIDADALVERIKEVYCKDCDNYNEIRCRACGTGDAIMQIDGEPTSDVAPRAEVARAMLKDVDNLLWRHKMRGIVNLDLIHNDIDKLKKKYTEVQK